MSDRIYDVQDGQPTLRAPTPRELAAPAGSVIVRVIGYTYREGVVWDMICQSETLGTITVDPWVGCALEIMTDEEKKSVIGMEFEMRDFAQHSSGVWLCHGFYPIQKGQP